MEKLNEKAAAISGAITGVVLHVIFGALVFGASGTMMSAYRNMYYNMMQFNNPGFAFEGLVISIVLGAIVGGFVGWLVAVSYNWGLKNS